MLAPEYYVLLAASRRSGMMFMAGGDDLIVIFLGLELMSISVYVLAGIDRRSARGAEAALKYFLLGAFASAFLLYGIALVVRRHRDDESRADRRPGHLARHPGEPAAADRARARCSSGFGFKVAAVPFHMWAPDVYDGAPTPVTAFMATAVKAAAFAALVRVLVEAFSATAAWQGIIVGGSRSLTMIVGQPRGAGAAHR